MQWARTQEVLKILHSQIPPKATNACGGRREEEQGRTQQMELQDLDPKASPHLEESWIGGTLDLDLLLQSSKDQRVWVEGLRGRQAFPKVNNGGERGEKLAQRVREPLGKKPP